ncbi:MAG: ATP-binding cassette domain-containing protein [bacterium]|nr:ATP-binding cassette domain-containing protein [bacterium]
MTLQINHLDFAFEGQDQKLFTDLSLSFGPGWTGLLGPNGAGKSTLLQLATGQLAGPQQAFMRPQTSLYLPQWVEAAPPGLEEFLALPDATAGRLNALLELGWDWAQRWGQLSPGERKRAQVGWALWQRPELLALDEPSNHLDAAARGLLSKALHSYPGTGILVTHDRELLSSLARQVVWIEPGATPIWAPTLELVLAEKERRRSTLIHQRQQVQAQLGQLRRRSGAFRDQANRSHQLRSKGRVDPKDHDAKAKINLARVSGKDGQAGKQLNQLSGRLAQVSSQLEELKVTKDHRAPIQLASKPSKRSLLLQLKAGRLPLGPQNFLEFPHLELGPQDRIALSGPNGAGKSCLLRHLMSRISLAPAELFYLPQEPNGQQIAQELLRLKEMPPELRGQVLALVGRLGSEPEALLRSANPSPGELRKLALAQGLLSQPALLLLDEPSNHLDLPSLLALEGALESFGGAILLITHDAQLAQRLCQKFWKIDQGRLSLG